MEKVYFHFISMLHNTFIWFDYYFFLIDATAQKVLKEVSNTPQDNKIDNSNVRHPLECNWVLQCTSIQRSENWLDNFLKLATIQTVFFSFLLFSFFLWY